MAAWGRRNRASPSTFESPHLGFGPQVVEWPAMQLNGHAFTKAGVSSQKEAWSAVRAELISYDDPKVKNEFLGRTNEQLKARWNDLYSR